jgi:hypothetical protein
MEQVPRSLIDVMCLFFTLGFLGFAQFEFLMVPSTKTSLESLVSLGEGECFFC